MHFLCPGGLEHPLRPGGTTTAGLADAPSLRSGLHGLLASYLGRRCLLLSGWVQIFAYDRMTFTNPSRVSENKNVNSKCIFIYQELKLSQNIKI